MGGAGGLVFCDCAIAVLRQITRVKVGLRSRGKLHMTAEVRSQALSSCTGAAAFSPQCQPKIVDRSVATTAGVILELPEGNGCTAILVGIDASLYSPARFDAPTPVSEF